MLSPHVHWDAMDALTVALQCFNVKAGVILSCIPLLLLLLSGASGLMGRRGVYNTTVEATAGLFLYVQSLNSVSEPE